MGAEADTPAHRVELELRDVAKTFTAPSGGSVTALEGVDLAVHRGECVTLIGPTGCGKTTLLNIVAGLHAPDRGQVRMADGLRPGANVLCVFQHYTLFPWRTVLRNVTFGMEMRGVPRRERRARARELLATMGLEASEGMYPHQLSGGMRQRTAIAQALAVDPRLLLMDEPFGALDDATRTELQGMLSALLEDSGMTVLFVTHSIDEALLLGDRVLVMGGRPGRIVRERRVDLARPRDRLSKEFTEAFVDLRAAVSQATSGAPPGNAKPAL